MKIDTTPDQYRADVLRSAAENTLWLNAFRCIRPTEELKRAIGEYVLRLLDEPESTILCDTGIGRVLILRVNKS